jgi:Tfp pilus assembly protein PilV
MQVLGARRQKDSARKELICLPTETRADVQQTVNHEASSTRWRRISARDNAPAGDTEPVRQPVRKAAARNPTSREPRHGSGAKTSARRTRQRRPNQLGRWHTTREKALGAANKTERWNDFFGREVTDGGASSEEAKTREPRHTSGENTRRTGGANGMKTHNESGGACEEKPSERRNAAKDSANWLWRRGCFGRKLREQQP